MSRFLLILANEDVRDRAIQILRKLPLGFRVTYHEPKRSTAQSDRMWAMLGDIATQTDWHGAKLASDDWKLLFMAGLKQEMRMVPNLDGNGVVSLGRSSSKLSVSEMSDLITLIQKFGDSRNVQFGDERKAA